MTRAAASAPAMSTVRVTGQVGRAERRFWAGEVLEEVASPAGGGSASAGFAWGSTSLCTAAGTGKDIDIDIEVDNGSAAFAARAERSVNNRCTGATGRSRSSAATALG